MADSALLAELLNQYGYLAVLVGTFLEGETVLLLAGTLAHEGYLRLPLVVLCAFMGSMGSDQLMYFLGRKYGVVFLEKRPHLWKRTNRVQQLLGRYDTVFILGFRFAYGLRTVAPALMGIQGIAPYRFLRLNTLGALIWSVTFSLLGYLVGGALEQLFGSMEAHHHGIIVALLVSLLILAGVFAHWAMKKGGCKKIE